MWNNNEIYLTYQNEIGRYSFVKGNDYDSFLSAAELDSPGLYAIANNFQIKGCRQIRYFGISNISVKQRLIVHLQNYLGGHYSLYNKIEQSVNIGDYLIEHSPGNADNLLFINDLQNFMKIVYNNINHSIIFAWKLHESISKNYDNLKYLESILISYFNYSDKTLEKRSPLVLENEKRSLLKRPLNFNHQKIRHQFFIRDNNLFYGSEDEDTIYICDNVDNTLRKKQNDPVS